MKDEAARRRETWQLGVAEDLPTGDLALEIMNIMEQGILVWNAEGVCELHNSRVFQVLELKPGDSSIILWRARVGERESVGQPGRRCQHVRGCRDSVP